MDLHEEINKRDQEVRRLRHELAVARGETLGNLPTWAEYAAAERAKEPLSPPKPYVSLETARQMAAEYAAREIADT